MHYNTIRYHKRRAVMLARLGGRCAGCGSDQSLEIHHRDPVQKSFDVSTEFSRPWPEIELELAKCELRCGTCHKAQHASKHGSLGMYTHHKCRCDLCRAAMSVKTKQYKLAAKYRRAALAGTQYDQLAN